MDFEPLSVPRGDVGAGIGAAGHEGGTLGAGRRGDDAFQQEVGRAAMPGAWPEAEAPLAAHVQQDAGGDGAVLHEPAEAPAAPVVAERPAVQPVAERVPEQAAEPAIPAGLSPETEALLERLENIRPRPEAQSTGYGRGVAERLAARIDGDKNVALQTQRLDNAISKLRGVGASGDDEKITAATKEALDAAKDLDSARKDIEKMVTTGAGNSITRFTTPIAAAVGGAGLAASLGLGIYTADQTHKRDEKNAQAKNA